MENDSGTPDATTLIATTFTRRSPPRHRAPWPVGLLCSPLI
jgi:hypothetical protein